MKRDLFVRAELGEKRQIRRNDVGNSRIAARSLMVSHQNYHLPVGKKLNRPEIYGG